MIIFKQPIENKKNLFKSLESKDVILRIIDGYTKGYLMK